MYHSRETAPYDEVQFIDAPASSLIVEDNGAGIGLYIAADAIGMLGGSIDLKPKHKEGTNFTVKIPNREL